MHRSTRIGWGALGFVALVIAAAPARACPPMPLSACRLAKQNTLSITRSSSAASNRFAWSWSQGLVTKAAEFGDPTAASSYELCVYDARGVAITLDVPAGGSCGGKPCWRATPHGFAYDDRTGGAVGVRTVTVASSTRPSAKVHVEGRGVNLPTALPLAAPLTLQLTRSDGDVCFESVFDAHAITRDDTARLNARITVTAATPMPTLSSVGCGTPLAAYAAGVSTVDSLVHDGIARSFRVYVPPGYDSSGATPAPVVLLLHGGFGSGAQVESSSRLLEVADANGFIVVSPDGVAGAAGVRTWNGGGCCGAAVTSGVDDVGFINALLDRLEAKLCLDRRRSYAAGMSNGAIMSHRLACDLAGRIRAVGSVAGGMMADPCAPVRPVPVIEIHGTGDLHVPYAGGIGCGAAGVPFPSVDETISGWRARDACSGAASALLVQGDGTCLRQGKCAGATDVALCTIPNGGHQWPGGKPPAISGLPGCGFSYQSQTFSASQVLWQFFSQHPPH